jgi:uncharacterized protein
MSWDHQGGDQTIDHPKYMKLTEKILAGLGLLGIILKLMLIPGGSIVFLLGIQLLSIVYFIFGFALFNKIRLRNIFKGDSYAHTNVMRIIGGVCTGLCLSVLLTGIMFKILLWPGAAPMLIIGLVPGAVILVIAFIKLLTTKNSYYTGVMIRMGAALLISMILCAVSNVTLVKIYHRDNPAYIELYEKLQQDPDNIYLQSQLESQANLGHMDPEELQRFREQMKQDSIRRYNVENAIPAVVSRKFPLSEGWTNDFGHLLKPEEIKDLNTTITAFVAKSHISIHLVTMDSVEMYDTSTTPLDDLMEEWSSSEDERIVLVAVSKYKRDVAITSDEETEKILTDPVCKKILGSMTGAFKNDDYYAGLKAGVLYTIKVLEEAPKN